MFDNQRVVFDVDLNSVHDGSRITTLVRHVTSFPFVPRVEAGDWVQVQDEDGNLWGALVETVEGQRVRLKIDWDIWTAPSHDMPSREIRGLMPSSRPDLSGLAR